ncbi:uncharacterized protein LOC132698067 isoform X2 [Cylas formicarius]|uniref:uncharacterized protein LOC132698067 isoform X2 n=1 Tax=Cylas formicarius TaxID=197179 RepID=UPI0029584E36|nr:uncharacterized protein LOC132698067 isoform X2 [Cylas formicarius]
MGILWTLAVSIFIFGFGKTVPAEQIDEASPDGLLDGVVNATLNTIIGNLPDPLSFADIVINSDSDILSGYINITKVEVDGLKEIYAPLVDAGLSLAVNLTLVLPKVTLDVEFDADSTFVKLLHFWGQHSSVSFTLVNAQVWIYGQADISNGLSIKDATIGFLNIDKLQFQFSNILNDDEFSDLLNDLLGKDFSDLFNDNVEYISRILTDIFKIISGGGSSTEVANEVVSLICARILETDSSQYLRKLIGMQNLM